MRAGVVAAVAFAAFALGAAPAVADAPLRATTSVSTRFLYFADAVAARVVVVVDRRQAVAGSLRVTAQFGAWDRVSPPRIETTSAGPLTRRSWSFTIACVEDRCLPHGTPLPVRLPPVTVSVQVRGGRVVTLRPSWPTLSVAPRFGAAAPGSTPAFALDRDLPRARYSVDPTLLCDTLDGVGALITGAALLLFARELLRFRRSASAPLPPLMRALTLVRQAGTRSVDDRRRAVGLLARTLEAHPNTALPSFASRLAWSKSNPAPERLDELVRMVETRPDEP